MEITRLHHPLSTYKKLTMIRFLVANDPPLMLRSPCKYSTSSATGPDLGLLDVWSQRQKIRLINHHKENRFVKFVTAARRVSFLITLGLC